MMRSIDNTAKLAMVDSYKSGLSFAASALAHGVDPKTVMRACHDVGIKPRRGGRYRTCSLNEHAFDVLTPAALYWLGFLFADGNISRPELRSRHSVSTGLATSDIGHIEAFREFIGSSHKVSTSSNAHGYGSGTLSKLTVDSRIMHARLAELGMRSKSLDRIAPPECAGSPDFWRGVIDGDGSIAATGKSRVRMELVGGEPLLEQFAEFVRTFIPHCAVTVRQRSHVLYCIQLASNNARTITKKLYGRGGPSLARKAQIAQVIIAEPMLRIRNRDLSGQIFFWLKVLSRTVIQGKRHGRTSGLRAAWVCKCVCGREKTILESELLAGRSKSCGCYQREFLRTHGKPFRFQLGHPGKYWHIEPQERDGITGRFISS